MGWAINPTLRFAPLFNQQAIWAENVVSGVAQPYLVSSSISQAIKGLLNNTVAPTSLEPETLAKLQHIGVLFDEACIQANKQTWCAQLITATAELQQRSFTIVRGLYNPQGASAFRAWVAHMRKFFKYDDTLVKNRIGCHNDVLCRTFHVQFSKVLIPLLPESVKPSYCYLGIYHDKAKLPKHTDREQCRWNVSVILDSDPEITSLNDSWPIYLEPAPLKKIRLDAVIGDAIIYRGDKIPHWRETLPVRFNQVSICFFHYVHQSFSSCLD